MNKGPHRQVWVKVSAQVDEGIAGLVSEMNTVPELQTLESCQGEPTEGSDGKVKCSYVYFYFGGWQQICELAFEEMAPALSGLGHVQVDRPGIGDPMGRVVIFPGSLAEATDALLQVLSRRKSRCSRDTEYTMPHSC